MLFKKRYVFLLFGALTLYWFSSSFQFRMDDEQIKMYFKNSVSPSIKYLTFGNTELRYLWKDNNQLTTVLFVHGSPGSATSFIDFFNNETLNASFNLLSIDRLGYGYSEYGNPTAELNRQAVSIKHIVDRLQLSRVLLVGHSLGASIVAKAAMQDRYVYKGLLLVAGSIDPELEPEEWFRPWLRNPLMKMLLPAALYVTNEEIFQLKPQLELMTDQWQHIQIPLLLIQGEDDYLVDKENANFLNERLSTEMLDVWMVEDTNHFIPWERPDLIVDGLLMLEEKI